MKISITNNNLQQRQGVTIKRWIVGIFCLVSLFSAVNAAAEPILQAVDIGALPGGRVQLRFQLSEPVVEPSSFTINEPARIVLDFIGTRSGLSANQQAINQGAAEQVTVLEGGDRTRASINLSRLVPYSVRAEGNSVLLTLEGGGSRVSTGAGAAPPSPAAAASNGAREIGNIDFRRGVQGEAIINISLSDPTLTVDVREDGSQIVADFLGASVPAGQERRLDVTDFATPVTFVDVFNQNGNARVTVQRSGEAEFLAYQTEGRYVIEVREVAEEKTGPDGVPEKVYTGELLSLNFQDIEVRAVLQIIADFTGLNVVVSDTVEGNVTLRLQNVPWDQALDIIMQTKGLTQRRNGNVIFIAPTEEVAAREKLELEAIQSREELVPLQNALIQVNYAKAEELKEILEEEGRGGEEDQESSSILSARGQLSADPRTNVLIVQDVPERIAAVRDLVGRLDIPVRQVLIDSRIVIASDDFSRELGVKWGFSGVGRFDDGVSSISGSAAANDGIINNALANLQETGQPFPVGVPALADRLGVDLGVAANPTGRIALALLGQDYLLDLELSALHAEGRGETLSNPRVLTTDRNEAIIKQGQQIPFQTIEDAEVKIEFVDAVLELKVTPQITPDGRVIMDLSIKKDEPIGAFVSAQSPPPIAKREVITQVLVDNGETVVLGGVYEQITQDNLDKVPLLGDIPAIGRLFQRRGNSTSKLELLIFVTPQIVTQGAVR